MTSHQKDFALRFRPALPVDWRDLRAAIGTQRVMLNANVFATGGAGLAAQLFHHHDFRIDPVTHRLTSDRGWTVGRNGPKSSYAVLQQAYGSRLPFTLGSVLPDWRRRGIATRQHYVEDVLRFQCDHLLRQTLQTPLFSVGEDDVLGPALDLERALRPGGLLLPYDPITTYEDLLDQVALWQVSPTVFENIGTEAVLALRPKTLDQIPLLQRIANAVLETRFSVIWFWIPDFKPQPTRVGGRRLRNLQSLVQRVSENKRVRFLNGGFTEMLFAFDGVEEVACNASLGTSTLSRQAGFGRIGQFYATEVHALIHYPAARAVVSQCRTPLDVARELCGCRLCRAVFSRGGANGFSSFFLSGTPLPTKNGGSSTTVERPLGQSDHANKMHGFVARTLERDQIRTSTIAQMRATLQSSVLALSAPQHSAVWTLGTLA